jgi:hypothetical protein
MAELRDVIAYILKKYPSRQLEELSNARLTKMVYLVDWLGCLSTGRQITRIKWRFDNHGPFVWDVKDCAQSNPNLFSVEQDRNAFGAKRTRFNLRDESYKPNLSSFEMSAVDKIINISSPLYWSDFISLVYGTHPIASSERYTDLDLVQKAAEYKATK